MADEQPTRTTITLRPGRLADAKACGRICYEAFGAIAAQHNFPADFPSVDVATDLMTMLLAHPRFFSVIAELDGAVVGSNFLDERSPVAGLGPITVDPKVQNLRIGRRLMQAALDRVTERGLPGVRLLQTAYHSRSLALYTTLGFQPREAIACMQGRPIGVSLASYRVRRAVEKDAEACNRVCTFVHGHHRGGEVLDAIKQGTASVVEHEGRITGYATDLAFFAHAVGETNRELMALIGAASAFGGPGILVPVRNAALFQWCLDHGLRVIQVMTLMTVGLYNEPPAPTYHQCCIERGQGARGRWPRLLWHRQPGPLPPDGPLRRTGRRLPSVLYRLGTALACKAARGARGAAEAPPSRALLVRGGAAAGVIR